MQFFSMDFPMAQNKRKSIHDNISLEGLDDIFDVHALKKSELQLLENVNSEKFTDIVSDTFLNKLKLKSSKKAVSEFVDNLPLNLDSKVCTLFEKVSTKKAKGRTKEKIREVVKIIVAHDEDTSEICYLEDKTKTPARIELKEADAKIDIIAEADQIEIATNHKHMEDELTSAYCKIEILENKIDHLKLALEEKDDVLAHKDQEVTWLKSQQDELSNRLMQAERTWWLRFKNWVLG